MLAFEIKAQILSALTATHEAILKAKSPEQLYEAVCTAAVDEGRFRTAAILLPGDDGWLTFAAIAGSQAADLKVYRLSTDARSAFGLGLCGTAFRDMRTQVSNDFQNDRRSSLWREKHGLANIGSAAAVPICRDGKSVGVFLCLLGASGAFDGEITELLERMSDNVAFVLGVFDRDQQRARAERANRRLTEMFAALSATNSAILRSTSRQEMFEKVCQAVASSGRSLGAAAIFIEQRNSHFLKLVATEGIGLEAIRRMEVSTDPDHPRGQGLAGPAFREQKLCIAYDLLADERTKDQADAQRSPYGGAAVPLLLGGRSVGVMYFFFARTSGRNDDEIKKLMTNIGENVSFALEMFERERVKSRMARMLGALSETNEAIVRAKSREELYAMVCEAAARGAGFTSTSIFLPVENDRFFKLGASAGPNADVIRSRRYSPHADHPQGQGLAGTAFREGRAAIQNDIIHQKRPEGWSFEHTERSNAKCGAAFPLFSEGKTIGVLLFMAAEYNLFSAEFVELLERLSKNVSLALENFDRRDHQRRTEDRVRFIASHDGLTGLPNRNQFKNLLEQRLTGTRRARQCAVLFIDLDRFKIINDSLGHAAGDTMLMEVSGRIRNCIRETDVVARLGGDEFVVLLQNIKGREEAAAAARRILQSIAPTMMLAGHECRTTASIGIAIYPEHGSDPDTLTKNADMAMYAAKEDGKNDFKFFSSEVKTQSLERLTLEAHLRRALDLDQFSLQYQPKLDVLTRSFNGVEALLRWTHPELGSIAPMRFIPLAEETGLIVPIGRWVLRTACEQAISWMRSGLPPLSMAVNLSPRQFADANLLADLDNVLGCTGLPPHLLQLEITESMVMQNVDRAIKLLDEIQGRGVRLAIDDFGTGYSSMSLMKQFPIDTIKIDRSFVRELETNEQDRAIANAIISMGKALGLTVVAEGVETAGQDSFLCQSACDELQGYRFSKPLPPDGIAALLSEMAPPIAPNARPRRLTKKERAVA